MSAGSDGRYEETFDDDLGGLNLSWTYTEPEPDTLYKWVAKMLNSQSATVIEASLTVRTPPDPNTTILSSDATLSDLTLSDVDFEAADRTFVSEGFHSTVTSYVGTVANSVTETTVTPTVNYSDASYVIKLGGVTDSDGTVSLAVGSNVITVEVTAEDGETSRTYTVTVTREQAPTPEKSSDATLSALALSGVNFGTFDSTTISYSARVANSVTQTTVTPTVNDSNASYVIKLGGVEDADGTVSLTVGSNTITIEVTAEDDSTTKSYTVTVTRVPNTPATGAPTISSTAEVGQTLTARTSGISDDDGLDNATYAYQWIRTEGTTDTDIAGATETTYLVTTDDVDRALGVRISFTDDAGNQESLTSAATVSVAARPNTPTPDAPDQPIATEVFVGGVDLEWNDVPGADSYDVQLYRNGQWIDLPGEGVEIAFSPPGMLILAVPGFLLIAYGAYLWYRHGVSGSLQHRSLILRMPLALLIVVGLGILGFLQFERPGPHSSLVRPPDFSRIAERSELVAEGLVMNEESLKFRAQKTGKIIRYTLYEMEVTHFWRGAGPKTIQFAVSNFSPVEMTVGQPYLIFSSGMIKSEKISTHWSASDPTAVWTASDGKFYPYPGLPREAPITRDFVDKLLESKPYSGE